MKVNEFKYKPKISELGYLNCNECYEHQKSITKSKFSDFVILKEALSDKIEYVFSAFGLLVDNALILKAKDCRVVFHHNSKEKFCLIQDNGNAQTLWDSHNDFISDLMIIKTYVEENIDQLEEIKEEDVSKRNFMKEEASNSVVPPQPIAVTVPNIVTAALTAANLKETKEQK